MAMSNVSPERVPLSAERYGEDSLPSARVVIERAKGLLMFRHGIVSYQAFAVLIRLARQQGIDVVSAAERLVNGANLERIRGDSGSARTDESTS